MTQHFPANELEVGLVAASQGRRTVQSWLEDLAQAKVWVPLDRSDDDASGTMRTITLDAKQYVPVFTSRHQLESTLGEAPMDHFPDSWSGPDGPVGALRQLRGRGYVPASLAAWSALSALAWIASRTY